MQLALARDGVLRIGNSSSVGSIFHDSRPPTESNDTVSPQVLQVKLTLQLLMPLKSGSGVSPRLVNCLKTRACVLPFKARST